MNTGTLNDAAMLSAGLLVVRVVIGLALAAHGSQKLLGWFGGYGLAGTGGFFETLGFRPGKLFAALVAMGEIGGGLLITLGLLGPLGPAVVVSLMLVAAVTVHMAHGFFANNNGVEVPVLFATAAFGLALTGPGAYSLDTVLGLSSTFDGATLAIAVLTATILGAMAALFLRKPVLSS